MKAKYLYRVTAVYADGHVWRRDYQSRDAAEERHLRLISVDTPRSVFIERSDPITWPVGLEDVR